ncbi:MAG: glycosyl transferase [Ruminococcus sp.]|nr:glycosyl transferase [Ruminococcus sp.]
MIPKKIHYCWFGRGEKPKKAEKCLASWKKYCPDYEIIEWNEDNFDINQNPYTKMAYETKKFAFLSDYARLLIIYNEGGLYFDVDVEIIKPIDDLLENQAFFGFETDEYVNTGVGFGAEKHGQIVKMMLDEYDDLLDGKNGTVGCPILNTRALIKAGLVANGKKQNINGIQVYPSDYFNPYDDPTGRLNKTENTYSIHWFAKSWMSRKNIIRSILTKPIHRLLGTNLRKG